MRLRYGHEVARLTFAQTTAKKAFDMARRGASKLVWEDVKVCNRPSPCHFDI